MYTTPILIVVLLLLQLSYFIYDKAILSSTVCQVCFSFHHHQYQTVHPCTPFRFCSFNAYWKIRSLHSVRWFDPLASASFNVVYCMDEACSSVCSILSDIHHPPSTPIGCTNRNPPTRTMSMMGQLYAFLASPAIPPCLLITCAGVV